MKTKTSLLILYLAGGESPGPPGVSKTFSPGHSLPIADQAAVMAEELIVPPLKGGLDPQIPADPLIYRFYEIMQVYGMPMKAVIHEKFGDGIMSAIDFSIEVDRVEDPKGDRVQVTMCGKFLPYKKW